jgi:1-aminocyclopropane-1-carboxylate deaminase
VSQSTFKLPSPLQEVEFSLLSPYGIRLFVKRDDLIHPEVSGNKWRKLQHNLAKAAQRGSDTVLTLGGAHSNHIAATAAAAQLFGLRSIGIIRGEEVDLNNPTLSFAASKGMLLHRISRERYREAGTWDFMDELKDAFGQFYFIPEGGGNLLGAMGCMDIVKELKGCRPQRMFVACGTATTLSGMAMANVQGAALYGVSALKGGAFLREVVAGKLSELYGDAETEARLMEHVHLLDNYHFGGYARMKPELLDFMRLFHAETGISLDPVYTAKCAYAMADLAGNLHAEGGLATAETWLLLHTGGMQGLAAMEQRMGMSFYPDC